MSAEEFTVEGSTAKTRSVDADWRNQGGRSMKYTYVASVA